MNSSNNKRLTAYIRQDQYYNLLAFKKHLKENDNYHVSISQLVQYSIDSYIGINISPKATAEEKEIKKVMKQEMGIMKCIISRWIRGR